MRIALTGASSTGKTTLVAAVLATPQGRKLFDGTVQVDARSMLRRLGRTQMDDMTPDELRCFQVEYYRRKVILEAMQERYIADRSFVDVAAYWLVRDTVGAGDRLRNLLTDRCRRHALRYDFHFLLPLGVVPFVHDGYRSEDGALHLATDGCIRQLLTEWKLPHEVLDRRSLDYRVRRVLAATGGDAK